MGQLRAYDADHASRRQQPIFGSLTRADEDDAHARTIDLADSVSAGMTDLNPNLANARTSQGSKIARYFPCNRRISSGSGDVALN